jgi:hypothetical protein
MVYHNDGVCGNTGPDHYRFGGTNLSAEDNRGLALAYPPKSEALSTLDGYFPCGDEGDVKNFTGPTDVAYGARGSFMFKFNLSGSVALNNATFSDTNYTSGDPLPGVRKKAYCKPSGYAFCGNEGDVKNFSAPTDIAYGASGTYAVATGKTGQVGLNNATFGDPVPGVFKQAFCKTQNDPNGYDADGYKVCAVEGQSVSVIGKMDVKYGTNGHLTSASKVTGRVYFNNSNFGDPAPGTFKAGYCRPSQDGRTWAY